MSGPPKLDKSGSNSTLSVEPSALKRTEGPSLEKTPVVQRDAHTQDGAQQKAYIPSHRAHDARPMDARVRLAEAQYSKWAGTYDAETASFGWCAPEKMLEWATEFAPPTGPLRVLDIGVGTGHASAPYIEAGAQVTGLDLVENMLVQARENLPAFHHLALYDINDPIETAGVRPGTYNLVLSCGTLHFSKDLAATLKTAADAVAPGGHFVFTYIPRQDRGFSEKTTTHLPSAVKRMLADAGLDVVKTDIFVAYYDQADPNDPVRYARVVAKKPGEAETIPAELLSMDRTTCVDRERVLKLFNTPLVEGPDHTKVVAGSNHAEVTAMLDVFREQMASGELDPAKIPLPTTTPKAAMAGAAKSDVLALLAHPDDESVYMGGTMGRLSSAERDIRLVHSTGGEGGRGGAPTELDVVRSAEQQAALAALGMDAGSFAELGFADFGKYTNNETRADPATAAYTLKQWDADKVLGALVRQIRTARPDTIVSFDPTRDPNYSLHGHHLAMGVATMLAYHLAADPESFPEQIAEGLAPWAARHHEVIVPDHTTSSRKTDVVIDGDKKLAALLAHASQRYSTDRLITRLSKNDESTRTESWHRLQTRNADKPSMVGALEVSS